MEAHIADIYNQNFEGMFDEEAMCRLKELEQI
jgi:hypothetical protein